MACKGCKKVFRKDSRYVSHRLIVKLIKLISLLSPFFCRMDNDESDEYCPYCDNHYVLPAVEPESQNINLSELLQQQLIQFNDPRMKSKFSDLDEEFEALLLE
jgi:hypothetical protein